MLSLLFLFVSHLHAGVTEKYALVIGNSKYADSPLNNPVNDAVDMSAKLTQRAFNVTTLLDANKRQMKTAITSFTRKLKEGSVGLFYYAGHGLEVKGDNYLIPISADIQSEADIEYEGINAGRILSNMGNADNSLNLVILDACRNNPFARSFRSSTRGLAKMTAPTGSMLMYATKPGDVAADGEGRNGIFTQHLLESLDKPGLTAEQVFKKTAAGVYRSTNKKQSPYIEGVMFGDFYFLPDSSVESAMPEPANVSSDSLIQVELAFWQSAEKLGTSEGYTNYLEKYPNGSFASLARQKIRSHSNAVAAEPIPITPVIAESDDRTTKQEKRHRYEPEMVRISGGSFMMGFHDDDVGDKKLHLVNLNAFEIGKYEVTQAQWQAMMGKNPSNFSGCDNCPVESISWNDIQTYLQKLNAKTGKKYRLPSEAEWEYACRSGESNDNYCGGNNEDQLAWHSSNSTGKTHAVGQKKANAYGLHDMSGNVWEWLQDCWNDRYNHPAVDGSALKTGNCNKRPLRGGSWDDNPDALRPTNRTGRSADYRYYYLGGFRLSRTLTH